MSVEAMAMVWKYSKQNGSGLLMLLAIADHAKEDGTGAWPSLSKLAEKTRMTRRNAIEVIKKLEADGELEILRGEGPRNCNLYNLVFPSEAQFTSQSETKEKVVKPSSPEVVKPDSPGSEAQFTSLVNQASPEPSITINQPSGKPSENPAALLPFSEDPTAGLPPATDGHQRAVDGANGAETDPVEQVTLHHYRGFMGGPEPLPGKKRERAKWMDAGRRLLNFIPQPWDVREVCAAVDRWWADDGLDEFWKDKPRNDNTVELIAKFVKNGGKHAAHRAVPGRDSRETFFDPETGQLVRKDPETGRLVPVP